MVPPNADLLPLTGLRAAAIVAVLACHFAASFVALLGLTPATARLLSLGGYGVSLFFVLSGFILCHAYHATTWRRRSYLRFLIKRLARIYPLHIAVLVGTVLLYEGARPFGYNQFAFDPPLFLRHATLTQAWWDYTWGLWNQASWSISAEWFAYLCFPVILGAVRLIKKPSQALMAAHGILLLFAIWMQVENVDIAFVHGTALPNILANFTAGCCAWRAWALWHRTSPRAFVAYTAFACIACLTAIVVGTGAVGWWLTLPFPLAVICLTDPKGNMIARLLSHPAGVRLGKASYATYMIHGTLQLIVYKMIPFTEFMACPLLIRVLLAFGYPTLMVIAGISAHVIYEHPARTFIVRRLKASIHGPDKLP